MRRSIRGSDVSGTFLGMNDGGRRAMQRSAVAVAAVAVVLFVVFFWLGRLARSNLVAAAFIAAALAIELWHQTFSLSHALKLSGAVTWLPAQQ